MNFYALTAHVIYSFLLIELKTYMLGVLLASGTVYLVLGFFSIFLFKVLFFTL